MRTWRNKHEIENYFDSINNAEINNAEINNAEINTDAEIYIALYPKAQSALPNFVRDFARLLI